MDDEERLKIAIKDTLLNEPMGGTSDFELPKSDVKISELYLEVDKISQTLGILDWVCVGGWVEGEPPTAQKQTLSAMAFWEGGSVSPIGLFRPPAHCRLITFAVFGELKPFSVI